MGFGFALFADKFYIGLSSPTFQSFDVGNKVNKIVYNTHYYLTAGYLFATLTGREEALDYGLALAALKHSVPGDALTTSLPEVERIVAREAHGIRR